LITVVLLRWNRHEDRLLSSNPIRILPNAIQETSKTHSCRQRLAKSRSSKTTLVPDQIAHHHRQGATKASSTLKLRKRLNRFSAKSKITGSSTTPEPQGWRKKNFVNSVLRRKNVRLKRRNVRRKRKNAKKKRMRLNQITTGGNTLTTRSRGLSMCLRHTSSVSRL